MEEEEDVEEDEEEEEEVEEEEDQVQSFNRPAKKQRTTKTNGVINGPIKSTPKTTKTADSMRKTLGKSNGKMNVDEGHDGISEDNGLFSTYPSFSRNQRPPLTAFASLIFNHNQTLFSHPTLPSHKQSKNG